jgi:hypothetical protein
MKTFKLASIYLFLLVSTFVSGQRVMTSFSPATHGFKFSNSFQTEPIQNIRFGGLCGGMAYSALDYYNTRRAIPTQTFRPADGTPLFNYIYTRQTNSIADNIDKWTELFVNPFGWRTGEFFNWGLQGFKGGRLQELRASIDAGKPVPLGLFKNGDGGAGPHHQVLAIGYDMGRYRGDLGANKEDLKIYIYDSNFPNQTMTLVPKPASNCYYYIEDTRCVWQTYFVDKKYRTQTPPIIATPTPSSEEMVSDVLLKIRTGGDDLRGGNDNVNMTIRFKSGASFTKNNINNGARWIDNYTQNVPIRLDRAVRLSDIASVTLTTTFGGGWNGDNWNMDMLCVMAAGREIYNASGAPLSRFDGNNRPFVANIPPVR